MVEITKKIGYNDLKIERKENKVSIAEIDIDFQKEREE